MSYIVLNGLRKNFLPIFQKNKNKNKTKQKKQNSVRGMTLLAGEAHGVTNLDCLPNGAIWTCSLGSITFRMYWVASSLFRQ